MEVFNERTPRERRLILVALALLLLFISWQFVFKPVMAAHQKSERVQITALRDFEIVQSSLPQIAMPATASKRSFDRTAVIQVANQSNVTISRVQPGQDEALQIWFEDVQVSNVYVFLTRMSEQYATRIGRVQISRRDGGVVSAQITLLPLS